MKHFIQTINSTLISSHHKPLMKNNPTAHIQIPIRYPIRVTPLSTNQISPYGYTPRSPYYLNPHKSTIVTHTIIPNTNIIINRNQSYSRLPFPNPMAAHDPIVPTADPAKSDVAVEKPKKVKKAAVKAKPRTPSLHPPYFEMIKEALVTLKERTGSSQYAIAKFIEENQKHLPANFKKVLLTQLKKLVAAGKLVKIKASYKLPAAKAPASAAPAKKKPVSKPKTAAKPKTVKKLTPAKKKTVAKPKPKAAVKAKAVAKPAVKAKAAATKAKAPVKSTPSKKAPKKAAVKSLKPKGAIAKKASGVKKVKK